MKEQTFESREPFTIVDGDKPPGEYAYPDESGYNFSRNATLNNLWVDTHVGQEFDLRYYFEIRRKGSSGWTALTQPFGKAFLAGNGATLDMPIRKEINPGDRLRVRVINNDSNGFVYDVNASIDVDYADMGKMSSILDKFGWF